MLSSPSLSSRIITSTSMSRTPAVVTSCNPASTEPSRTSAMFAMASFAGGAALWVAVAARDISAKIASSRLHSCARLSLLWRKTLASAADAWACTSGSQSIAHRNSAATHPGSSPMIDRCRATTRCSTMFLAMRASQSLPRVALALPRLLSRPPWTTVTRAMSASRLLAISPATCKLSLTTLPRTREALPIAKSLPVETTDTTAMTAPLMATSFIMISSPSSRRLARR
mmetsp:Transcript_41435/g.98211  ORF Transcript_41435/g.98211 Transcript_41435/m.98211 type:complete len:228 (-) Transcript_41435:158-841(-)